MIEEIDTDGSGTVDFDGKDLNYLFFKYFILKKYIHYRIHGNDDWIIKGATNRCVYHVKRSKDNILNKVHFIICLERNNFNSKYTR